MIKDPGWLFATAWALARASRSTSLDGASPAWRVSSTAGRATVNGSRRRARTNRRWAEDEASTSGRRMPKDRYGTRNASTGTQLPTSLSRTGHTALIDIEEVVGSDPEASADNVVTGLREAFEDAKTKGVILRINSPGGSAVHAGYINNEVYRLRAKYPDIPVYAVITDVCASGGYYIAVAANRIFADKASR